MNPIEPAYHYNRLIESVRRSGTVLSAQTLVISNVGLEWSVAGQNLSSALNELMISVTSGNGVKESAEKVAATYRSLKSTFAMNATRLIEAGECFEGLAREIEISMGEDGL
jgi:hypothetical protein